MRSFACTLTLFVAALGLIATGFIVRLPDYLNQSWNANATLPLVFWLIIYVGGPLCVAAIAGIALYVIWLGCSDLCAKLRGAV